MINLLPPQDPKPKNYYQPIAFGLILVCLILIAVIGKNYFFIKKNSIQESSRVNSIAATPKVLGQSEAVVSQSSTNQSLQMIFGGDVMLSRVVGQKMEKYQNFSWPFVHLKNILAAADFTAINLESPFAKFGPYFVPTGSFSFKADPRGALGLKEAGIDLISLANNHITNAGVDNLLYTKRFLLENGLATIGAGANLAQAHQPHIVVLKGRTYGFLAYAYPGDGQQALNNSAGTANLNIKLMQQDIAELKAKVNTIIVIMHAGEEYTAKPNAQQIAFARAAVAAGAKVVIGHHAHWPQQIEQVKDGAGNLQGLIVYGLGNLVFDQMWSKETRLGALAEIDFQEDTLQQLKIIPIKIFDYGQPQLATSTEDINSVLGKMGLATTTIIF